MSEEMPTMSSETPECLRESEERFAELCATGAVFLVNDPAEWNFATVGGTAPCDMCAHPEHYGTDCGAQVGYDHLNGDHECGCPGSMASLLAQAWDEGHGTSNGGCVYWPDCAEIGDHVNPYRAND